MGKIIAIVVTALLTACGAKSTPPTPVAVTDQPSVLIVAGPTAPTMQEFSTHKACGEAAAHIEIRSGGRYYGHCVLR